MMRKLAGLVMVLMLAIVPNASFAHTLEPLVIDGDVITSIVASPPGAPGLLVTGSAGIYELGDGEWTSQAPAPPPGRLVSAGDDSGFLLVGDRADCMRGGADTPLQRSEDGGATWTAVETTMGMRPLAIWAEADLAVATSCVGLEQSTDAGVTWSPVAGIDAGFDVTAFAAVEVETGGPKVLIGLTGEGGTSSIHSVDFSDPVNPVVSAPLRQYLGIGGLAGRDDTFVLAAIDGIWISEDAGATWTRSAEGLEDVVVPEDPLVHGLPQDIDPNQFGLQAVAFVHGEGMGLVVGSVDGLYHPSTVGGAWTRIDGTEGNVNQLVVSADGATVVWATDDGVFEVALDVAH